jgi:hypothetical protein
MLVIGFNFRMMVALLTSLFMLTSAAGHPQSSPLKNNRLNRIRQHSVDGDVASLVRDTRGLRFRDRVGNVLFRPVEEDVELRQGIEPMDLANMRQNGVRSLEVACFGCRHGVIVNVDMYPGEFLVRDFGSRAAWSAPTSGRTGKSGSVTEGKHGVNRPDLTVR